MLRTKGKAGHSSAPRPDNAIGPPPAASCRGIPTSANQRGYRRAQRTGSTGQRATVFDGVHPSTVRYEYEVDGVRWRVGYDALIAPPPSGRAITIEYAAALPGWSRIAGTRRTGFPWFLVAFVLFFPVFGAGMIIRSVRANRREVFEGALTSMKLLELQAFNQADEVVVLYEPTDPRRNALYVP